MARETYLESNVGCYALQSNVGCYPFQSLAHVPASAHLDCSPEAVWARGPAYALRRSAHVQEVTRARRCLPF